MGSKRKRSEGGDDEFGCVKKVVTSDVPILENEPTYTYEEGFQLANKIAEPMATKKLFKKLCKLSKKVMGDKKMMVMGLKNVKKHIRRGSGPGLVLLAGDVLPIDIYSHMPVICEDAQIPYCFIPTRQYLGKMLNVSRSVMMVLIRKNDNKYYQECEQLIQQLPAHF